MARVHHRVEIGDVISNPSCALVLRKFLDRFSEKQLCHKEHAELATSLIRNLLKNTHQIRILTLQILKKFQVLKYVEVLDDTVEVSEYYKD